MGEVMPNLKALLATGTGLALALTSSQVAAQVRNFNIDAMSADKAVQELARQGGIQVIAPSAKLRGVRTKAVQGSRPVNNAIDLLLQGTSLKAEKVSDGVYVIKVAEMSAAAGSLQPMRASLVQSAPVSARAALPVADERSAPEPVGEIIVTANRREQSMQDVAVSVTALDQGSLQTMNITSAIDIVRVVPSMKTYAFSPSGVVYNIRGVSQNDFGDAAEPPVAVYTDDTYGGSIGLASFPLFDIQRVEALRGPQGTLFGRNATAGAIQYISNRPSSEFGASAGITYRRFNYVTAEGMITGPVTDTLSARLAGQYESSDGYLKNIGPGKRQGALNHWAVRGMLEWKPTDATDVLLILRYSRNDRERYAGGYSGDPAYVTSEHGQGDYLPPDMHNPLADVYFPGNNFGPGTDAGGYRNDANYDSRGGDPFTIATNYPSYFDRKIFGASLHIDHEFENGLKLTSISSYQKMDKYFQADVDGSPVNLSIWITDTKVEQITQELRAYAELGRHNVTFGAFGMLIRGEYGGGYQVPALNYFPYSNKTLDTDSFAFFVEDEWKFADKLTLIAGARYWRDKRRLTYNGSDNFGNSLILSPDFISPAAGVTEDFLSRSFSSYTMRLGLNYQPNSRTLLYAAYNRGSKAGGYTLPDDPPFAGNEASFTRNLPYDSETLHSFEVGAKLSLAPRTTLNATAFYYIYNNYQAQSIVGTDHSIFNKDARVKGVEVEFTTQPIDNLTLQFSGSYLDTKVLDVQLPDGSFTEPNLPQAPRFSGNAIIRYDFDLGPNSAYVQADGLYSGKSCYTVLCAPVEREGAYALLNGRIGVNLDNGLELRAFVENITNTKYRLYAVDTAAISGTVISGYAMPRVWGIGATYRFGGR